MVGRLALLPVAVGCAAVEPKMSSTLDELRLLRLEDEEALGTAFSL